MTDSTENDHKVEEMDATNSDNKEGTQLGSVSRTVSMLDDASDHLAQITQEMEEAQEQNSQNLLEALKLVPRKRPHPVEEGVSDSTRETGEGSDIMAPGTKKSNSGNNYNNSIFSKYNKHDYTNSQRLVSAKMKQVL